MSCCRPASGVVPAMLCQPFDKCVTPDALYSCESGY